MADDTKLTDEQTKLLQEVRANTQGLIELRSTTSAVTSALKMFVEETKETSNKFNKAAASVEEQKIANDRLKRSLGILENTTMGAYKIGAAKVELAKKEYAFQQIAVKQAQELLDLNTKKIAADKSEIAAIAEKTAQTTELLRYERAQVKTAIADNKILEERISAIKNANILLQKEANSSKDLERYMQSQLTAAQEAIAASKDNIASIRDTETVQKARIDAINKEIRQIEKRGEFKGQGPNVELTTAEKTLVASLMKKEAGILASFEESKRARQAEQESLDSLVATWSGMVQENTEAMRATAAYESAIASNTDVLYETTLEQMAAKDAIRDGYAAINAINKEQNENASQLKTLNTSLKAREAVEGDLQAALRDRIAEEKTRKDEIVNATIAKWKNSMKQAADGFGQVAAELRKLVDPIRAMQQQLGITAGTAAKLKLTDLAASAKSVMSGGAPVSGAEIQTARTDFQSQFGGALTSGAAKDLAIQAKEMGVSTKQLADARRVFMTQTMGNVGEAKVTQDKFIGEFTKRGLTSKDAMEAIGQNSELLARNGTRFATSFARAAVEAKKIGVDLSKVDQIGDSIIGDFEGFLEKTSELGAMGFNIDANSLAQLAESGDTGALMGELRSQLASTGKDITKLRRSEQQALSGAFGIPMAELQRLAGPTNGSGEATLSPEELQKDANTSLTTLVDGTEKVVMILEGIALVLGTIVASKTLSPGWNLAKRVMSGGGVTGGISSALAGAGGGGGGVASLAGAAPTPSAGGGGAVGQGMSFMDKLNPAKMLAGAAAMLIVSGALWVTAKALNEFNTVNWDSLGKAGLAMLGLVGAVAALGALMASGVGAVAILAGAAAMVVIAGSLWVLANAIQASAEGLQAFIPQMKDFGTVLQDFPVAKLVGFGYASLIAAPGIVALGLAGKISGLFGSKTEAAPTPLAPSVETPVTGMVGLPANNLKKSSSPATPQVDMVALSAKLDQVIRAIGSMEVHMDGAKVGKVLVNSSDAAASFGTLRQQARATF